MPKKSESTAFEIMSTKFIVQKPFAEESRMVQHFDIPMLLNPVK